MRISDDKEGAGLGVERQEADCRRLAEQRGYRIIQVFSDNDTSAYKRNIVRKDYERMMDQLRAGVFSKIIVWHLDRLWRQPRELEDMIELCENGERQVVSCYGDYDLANPDGCFMARLQVAQANKSSADLSRRIKRKLLANAKAGKAHGHQRPFGFKLGGRELDPEEAPIVRELAHRLLAGEPMHSIVVDLDRRGIRGTSGARLGWSGLRKILTSARISGQREYHGEIIAKGEWPAIITPDETERIRAVLRNRSRNLHPARRSLLTGFLRCGLCGAKMHGNWKERGGHVYYRCHDGFNGRRVGCDKLSRRAGPIDALITEAVFAVLDSPEMAQAVEAEPHDAGSVLMAAIADDQSQLAELAAAYAAKRIKMTEWLAARDLIEQRIKGRSAEYAKLAEAAGTRSVVQDYVGRGGVLRQDWSHLTLDQQRVIIGEVIDHIVVLPSGQQGRRPFNPATIKPVWKVHEPQPASETLTSAA